jgi:hypothetical protein
MLSHFQPTSPLLPEVVLLPQEAHPPRGVLLLLPLLLPLVSSTMPSQHQASPLVADTLHSLLSWRPRVLKRPVLPGV